MIREKVMMRIIVTVIQSTSRKIAFKLLASIINLKRLFYAAAGLILCYF